MVVRRGHSYEAVPQRPWSGTGTAWSPSMTSQRSTGGTFARRTQWTSPFAALRLRTDAAKRYKRVDRAIAVIWKMLMGRRRTLQASEGP